MKTTALNLAIIILCFSSKAATGDVISLYDSSSASIPTAQGWIYLTDPLFLPEAQMALVEQGTELNSLPNMTDKAGFFSSMPPLPAYHPGLSNPLDRMEGFELVFDIQLLEETHIREDRAGFSVIVVSDDLQGIEIGFWKDAAWGQERKFSQAEKGRYPEAVQIKETTRFQLRVQSNRYYLSVNQTPLVSGPLRDYSGFGIPYNIPNFLFLGDDTTSAAARVIIHRVFIETHTTPLTVYPTLVGRHLGDFRLGWKSFVGARYRVESTIDFKQWSPEGNTISSTDLWTTSSILSGSIGMTFWRVQLLE
ncbi:MAG: hypothetical protein P8L18_03935 [Verrucomicrobiota bacterium]|nr:hypothetical protein [Verrucomicrobiota bacterium]